MPRVVVGKNKFGNPKVLTYPGTLFDSRGNTAWREWEVKNRFRDSSPVKLFDSNGRLSKSGSSGLLYDRRGKPLNGRSLLELSSKRELSQFFQSQRKSQERYKWMPRRLRNGGLTLAQLEHMHEGQEMQAIRLLLRDSFFGTAITTGKMVIPENKLVLEDAFIHYAGKLPQRDSTRLTMELIRQIAQDYFFKEMKKEIGSRRKALSDGKLFVLDKAKTSDLVVSKN